MYILFLSHVLVVYALLCAVYIIPESHKSFLICAQHSACRVNSSELTCFSDNSSPIYRNFNISYIFDFLFLHTYKKSMKLSFIDVFFFFSFPTFNLISFGFEGLSRHLFHFDFFFQFYFLFLSQFVVVGVVEVLTSKTVVGMLSVPFCSMNRLD